MIIGRNDPCPCGSGKKYKKCCLIVADAARAEQMRAAHEERRRHACETRERAAQLARALKLSSIPKEAMTFDAFDDDLEELTNSVLDLIDESRFDEALAACERLLVEYPEVHDGFERSALVHDALGNHAIAAEFWQKAVEFVESPDRRDDYDEEFIEGFRRQLSRARERAAASEGCSDDGAGMP